MSDQKTVIWSSYENFSGPMIIGVHKFVLPDNPSWEEKLVAVITATEGGHYDSVNMYDTCIVSLSLIQLCDSQYFMSTALLGHIAETCGIEAVTGPLAKALKLSNATFEKMTANKWRFKFLDERGWVDTASKQRDLCLKSSGKKNEWTDEAKEHAKTWAVCFADIWDNENARKEQLKYVASKAEKFVMNDAKKILWDDTPNEGWVGALRCAYISYSANLPAVANSQLKKALEAEPMLEKWSPEWCTNIMKYLTFGGEIKIYPVRYNAIRPVLEAMWGVTLPKTAEILKKWTPAPSSSQSNELYEQKVDTSIVVSNEAGMSQEGTGSMQGTTPSIFQMIMNLILAFLNIFRKGK